MQSPSRPGAGQPTVDGFLRTVLRSGVLNREQLRAALRAAPVEARDQPQAVAEHLIRQGKLSRFQARKLLKGSSVGLVLGPFQVLAPVGKGGMGTVYLARDERSGQLLALKVLPPKKALAEPRVLARFRREMEMCRRVAHPHLAWTCEVGVCQGVYYIAMEYIPGKSLHRLVAESGPPPAPRAARLAAQVASALEHAHNQGLVHRDIKPANVLVTPHDQAKVLDLGLALERGEKGSDRLVVGGQGYVVGTMDYIAPEQIADPCAVDGRSDVYSLGCTLFHTLTGRPPFPGGTSKEKMQRQLGERPPQVSELNPSVPAGLAAAVKKMMAKDPARRFQTAAEAEDELRRWAGDAETVPDQPGDPTYADAVALVEAEPASDQVDEPILDEDTSIPVIESPFVEQYRRRGRRETSRLASWAGRLRQWFGRLTGK